MNAATVAEHVENDLIAQQMRSFGMDYAQGFGIGRPKPLSDVLQTMGPPIMIEDSGDTPRQKDAS